MKKEIVSLKVLRQRISSVLSRTDQALRCCNDGWGNDLGEWYVVNLADGSIDHAFVDLAELATYLGCLKTWEKIGR